MARLLTTGGETGHTYTEAQTITTTGSIMSIQSTTKRSGTYAYQGDSGAGNATGDYRIFADGGTGVTWYLRFWAQASSLPSSNAIIAAISDAGGVSVLQVRLNTDGTLNILNSAGSTISGSSTSGAVSAATWFSVEVSLTYSAGGNETVGWAINGTTVDSGLTQALTTLGQSSIRIGWLSAPGASKSIYFDDISVNDESGSAETTAPSRLAKTVILLPTTISNKGSWTGGSGGTTDADMITAVTTRPPAGTATETNTSQIESAATSGTNAITFVTGTYTAAGVASGDTVHVVFPIIVDGEDVSTGTKDGSFRVSSNPTDSGATTFEAGDNAGALGTFPSTWSRHRGALVYAPSPTLGTGATLVLTDIDTSNRVQSCCFFGLMVEYTVSSGDASVTTTKSDLALGNTTATINAGSSVATTLSDMALGNTSAELRGSHSITTTLSDMALGNTTATINFGGSVATTLSDMALGNTTAVMEPTEFVATTLSDLALGNTTAAIQAGSTVTTTLSDLDLDNTSATITTTSTIATTTSDMALGNTTAIAEAGESVTATTSDLALGNTGATISGTATVTTTTSDLALGNTTATVSASSTVTTTASDLALGSTSATMTGTVVGPAVQWVQGYV
jgi:uncharacterized cupredoxin-like copper-binding protein